MSWIAVLAATSFLYFYQRAKLHLQLKLPTSIQGILLGESGWSIKVCSTLNVPHTSKEGWLSIEAPTESYLSRYFILLKVRDMQGRQFQQWLTPRMVGESEYRKLCGWLLTQKSEDKKQKLISMH